MAVGTEVNKNIYRNFQFTQKKNENIENMFYIYVNRQYTAISMPNKNNRNGRPQR